MAFPALGPPVEDGAGEAGFDDFLRGGNLHSLAAGLAPERKAADGPDELEDGLEVDTEVGLHKFLPRLGGAIAKG